MGIEIHVETPSHVAALRTLQTSRAAHELFFARIKAVY